VSPGVVSVETRSGAGGATGSGFVLDGDGYILTNDHVVDKRRERARTFPEGGAISARLVAPTPRPTSRS